MSPLLIFNYQKFVTQRHLRKEAKNNVSGKLSFRPYINVSGKFSHDSKVENGIQTHKEDEIEETG